MEGGGEVIIYRQLKLPANLFKPVFFNVLFNIYLKRMCSLYFPGVTPLDVDGFLDRFLCSIQHSFYDYSNVVCIMFPLLCCNVISYCIVTIFQKNLFWRFSLLTPNQVPWPVTTLSEFVRSLKVLLLSDAIYIYREVLKFLHKPW